MAELLPNREQARRLVVTLATFWAAWAVAVIGFTYAPAVAVVAFFVGFAALMRFYLTLYAVWEPESGISPLRMMLVRGRARMRADRHMLDLLRPSWVKHTLRETGWPTPLVGFGLLALLVLDLVVAVVVLAQQ